MAAQLSARAVAPRRTPKTAIAAKVVSRAATGAQDVPLTLALPKGRILDESVELFARAGIDLSAVKSGSRKLIHVVPAPADLGGALRLYQRPRAGWFA